MNAASAILTVAIGVTALGLYFFPTLIAMHNHKRNTPAIFLVNLALGWTLVFWFVCIVWSMLRD